MGSGGSRVEHHHHRDHAAEKALTDKYERMIKEQNDRRDREENERNKRAEETKSFWAQKEESWRQERESIRRETEERKSREAEAYRKAQKALEDDRRRAEENARMERERHEAKIREMDAARVRDEQARKNLEAEMKQRMDDTIKRTEEEKKKNEERKKKVEEMLKKSEEERVRAEKEKKEQEEQLKKAKNAMNSKQEELNRQKKKAEEMEKQRIEREATMAAEQEELNKKRDAEIGAAKEKADVEMKARQKAEEEREKAKDDLIKGIRPEMIPTEEDIRRVKGKLQYNDDHFHFAVCGQAGTGKSSMINAFRGLKPSDPMAAKVKAVESTQVIGRYPDHDKRPPRSWIVWYDIPGGGTPNISDWQYFNDQGLYIFDLIVLIVGDRFTDLDKWIIKNCQRFQVPCFIVRSKSDHHIENIAKDEFDYDREDEDQDHKDILEQARRLYIEQTRSNFEMELKKGNLPSQKTYMVASRELLKFVNGNKAKMIDEADLIKDLMQAAFTVTMRGDD